MNINLSGCKHGGGTMEMSQTLKIQIKDNFHPPICIPEMPEKS